MDRVALNALLAGVTLLGHALALGHAASALPPPRCALNARLQTSRASVCLADKQAKLMLCSSPKAAATTVAAIAMRVFNLSDESERWLAQHNYRHGVLSTDLHRFRRDALERRPRHRLPDTPIATCSRRDWLCVFVVRNPLDRAISSFLHVAFTPIGVRWPELAAVGVSSAQARAGNFSFRTFVGALELTRDRMRAHARVASSPYRTSWCADHYLPQTAHWLAARPSARPSGVHLVPVDALVDGLAAADAEFARGRFGLGIAGSRLHSAHWHTDASSASRPHASSPSAGRRAVLPAANGELDAHASTLCGYAPGQVDAHTDLAACALPAGLYARMQRLDDALWARVRCLYQADVALHAARVCAQPWLLRRCPRCASMCRGSADPPRRAGDAPG
ncbi:hypothetical protein KFE25_003153 [Diacronema lutheri]|uniref:Uncharacterized protein n=1 Tax=Diacronema lutheri TaxID=2081491 RepID=A0A7R9UQ08_DIALT|nr:hypothetical protein KFE25_003153 [Diacronema lutheri]|mmetsp:Transcript_19885/g.61852  ORF Transcript_19885/g.61852 Transcript_19885/m.61852 type:complete len:393 (+) Transcript_19885:46-1224(+)